MLCSALQISLSLLLFCFDIIIKSTTPFSYVHSLSCPRSHHPFFFLVLFSRLSMELVQEIFVTVSVAILLSFLVAKLVSMAMAGDGGGGVELKSGEGVGSEVAAASIEEMKFGEQLSVGGSESETRVVEFVEKETEKVDEHEVEGESEVVKLPENLSAENSAEEVVVMERVGEVMVEEFSELQEKLLKEGKREEKSELVELPEILSAENSGEEEVVVMKRDGDCDNEKAKEGEVDEIGLESGTDDVVADQSEEIRVVRTEAGGGDGEEGLIDGDEDDWEGIERSELEKEFAAAAAFVGGGGGEKDGRLASLGSDMQMQLYGLHKIATEGRCYETQPMALKISARAKWNAWQRQGNMSPEVAMEQYIAMLSDRVPGWMEDKAIGESKNDILKAGKPIALDPDSNTSLHHQANSRNKMEPDPKSCCEGVDTTGSSNTANRDNE